MSAKHKYGPQEIKAFFAKVDWDFADAWTRYGLNLIHWYPTKLAPQVASKLIAGLSGRGDIVLDPFCGSGTVLAEAMRLGRHSIGIDISPLACMIATARTTLIPLPKLDVRLTTFLETVRFGLELLNHSVLPLPTTHGEKEALALIRSSRQQPINTELSKWFHPDVYRDICFVTECIALEPDKGINLLLTTTLSSLLRTCCSQPRSWGYIADNVAPKQYIYKNIYNLLVKRIRALKLGMQMSIEQCALSGLNIQEANKLTTVIVGDTRHITAVPPESVDCIVTSPPYANVSDNVTSQRLSMLWLGYDVDTIKQMEIGARWKRFRKESLENYVVEMQQSLAQMWSLLKLGGRLALILGSSPKWEHRYSTLIAIDSHVRKQLKMEELATFSRKLPATRQHGSHGVMDENIFVYRKK